MKRRRKPRTIDGLAGPDNLEDFPGFQDNSVSYDFGSSDQYGWHLTADPSIVKTEVPNDTPLDSRVVAVSRDFPRAGVTSWYAPTSQAVVSGKVQAAVDTIASTGAQLTAAGESMLGIAGAVVQNLPLILAGIVAMYLLFQWEKTK